MTLTHTISITRLCQLFLCKGTSKFLYPPRPSVGKEVSMGDDVGRKAVLISLHNKVGYRLI